MRIAGKRSTTRAAASHWLNFFEYFLQLTMFAFMFPLPYLQRIVQGTVE